MAQRGYTRRGHTLGEANGAEKLRQLMTEQAAPPQDTQDGSGSSPKADVSTAPIERISRDDLETRPEDYREELLEMQSVAKAWLDAVRRAKRSGDDADGLRSRVMGVVQNERARLLKRAVRSDTLRSQLPQGIGHYAKAPRKEINVARVAAIDDAAKRLTYLFALGESRGNGHGEVKEPARVEDPFTRMLADALIDRIVSGYQDERLQMRADDARAAEAVVEAPSDTMSGSVADTTKNERTSDAADDAETPSTIKTRKETRRRIDPSVLLSRIEREPWNFPQTLAELRKHVEDLRDGVGDRREIKRAMRGKLIDWITGAVEAKIQSDEQKSPGRGEKTRQFFESNPVDVIHTALDGLETALESLAKRASEPGDGDDSREKDPQYKGGELHRVVRGAVVRELLRQLQEKGGNPELERASEVRVPGSDAWRETDDKRARRMSRRKQGESLHGDVGDFPKDYPKLLSRMGEVWNEIAVHSPDQPPPKPEDRAAWETAMQNHAAEEIARAVASGDTELEAYWRDHRDEILACVSRDVRYLLDNYTARANVTPDEQKIFVDRKQLSDNPIEARLREETMRGLVYYGEERLRNERKRVDASSGSATSQEHTPHPDEGEQRAITWENIFEHPDQHTETLAKIGAMLQEYKSALDNPEFRSREVTETRNAILRWIDQGIIRIPDKTSREKAEANWTDAHTRNALRGVISDLENNLAKLQRGESPQQIQHPRQTMRLIRGELAEELLLAATSPGRSQLAGVLAEFKARSTADGVGDVAEATGGGANPGEPGSDDERPTSAERTDVTPRRELGAHVETERHRIEGERGILTNEDFDFLMSQLTPHAEGLILDTVKRLDGPDQREVLDRVIDAAGDFFRNIHRVIGTDQGVVGLAETVTAPDGSHPLTPEEAAAIEGALLKLYEQTKNILVYESRERQNEQLAEMLKDAQDFADDLVQYCNENRAEIVEEYPELATDERFAEWVKTQTRKHLGEYLAHACGDLLPTNHMEALVRKLAGDAKGEEYDGRYRGIKEGLALVDYQTLPAGVKVQTVFRHRPGDAAESAGSTASTSDLVVSPADTSPNPPAPPPAGEASGASESTVDVPKTPNVTESKETRSDEKVLSEFLDPQTVSHMKIYAFDGMKRLAQRFRDSVESARRLGVTQEALKMALQDIADPDGHRSLLDAEVMLFAEIVTRMDTDVSKKNEMENAMTFSLVDIQNVFLLAREHVLNSRSSAEASSTPATSESSASVTAERNEAAVTEAREWWKVPHEHQVDVIGDNNGSFEGFLANALDLGVINAEGHWAGGDRRLVMVGDIWGDRQGQGDLVLRKALELREEARSNGGDIFVLAGNHDIAAIHVILSGDSDDGGITPLPLKELDRFIIDVKGRSRTKEDGTIKKWNAKIYDREAMYRDPVMRENILNIVKAYEFIHVQDDILITHGDVPLATLKRMIESTRDVYAKSHSIPDDRKHQIPLTNIVELINTACHDALRIALGAREIDGGLALSSTPPEQGSREAYDAMFGNRDALGAILTRWPASRHLVAGGTDSIEDKQWLKRLGVNTYLFGHNGTRAPNPADGLYLFGVDAESYKYEDSDDAALQDEAKRQRSYLSVGKDGSIRGRLGATNDKGAVIGRRTAKSETTT